MALLPPVPRNYLSLYLALYHQRKPLVFWHDDFRLRTEKIRFETKKGGGVAKENDVRMELTNIIYRFRSKKYLFLQNFKG